jgi:hypothetical protein
MLTSKAIDVLLTIAVLATGSGINLSAIRPVSDVLARRLGDFGVGEQPPVE